MSFKWLLRVLKGGRENMLTSPKITQTSYHYISIKKTDILNWKRFFYCKLHCFTSL